MRKMRGVTKILGCKCNNQTIKLMMLAVVAIAGLYLLNAYKTGRIEGFSLLGNAASGDSAGMESSPLELPFDKDPPPFQGNKKETLLLIHAEWCGHCKKLMPDWKSFANNYKQQKSGPNIGVATLNEAKMKENVSEEIVKDWDVQSFPTILVVDEHYKKVAVYDGDRSVSAFETFANSR